LDGYYYHPWNSVYTCEVIGLFKKLGKKPEVKNDVILPTEKLKLEYKNLLSEVNNLMFHCDKCRNDWTMRQPEKTWVRSSDGTNSFIPKNDEHGKHTFIHCPKCKSTRFIRRVAPRIRPSTSVDFQKKLIPNTIKNFEMYE
jgi:hypothetical protein